MVGAGCDGSCASTGTLLVSERAAPAEEGAGDHHESQGHLPHQNSLMQPLLSKVNFVPPRWCSHLIAPKHGRVRLGHLPTPLMPWAFPALKELGVEWWIKRDDLSGLEMSGNKVRKLEFLLADALATGHDCVVTIGGLQSNHCRATAAAARLVGLEPHIVLLVSDRHADEDPGLDGNLLLGRVLGAKLHLCASRDYYRYGGDLHAMEKLNNAAADKLRREGRKPYVIPVGGTTPFSAWGYINAVDELQQQLDGLPPELNGRHAFDHIVVTAGSGGTTSGLALGCHFSGLPSQLHAVNIQHTADVYYDLIAAEASALGVDPAIHGDANSWLQIHNGAGSGYATTSDEQLAFICDVAAASGVILDHIYTGKALYYFCQHVRDHPEEFRNKRVLFWHTGGLYALASQSSQLSRLLPREQIQRLEPP
eukprot:TRINITY_DN20413_c0_g1_i3.p1 TRINITY_DN20413_c0_g1~~TRINITY_DN20413_c0_g1_i3.p1  ORF type:complete len:423 (+),score=63.13 TRINITY_DN20413_c0_g1_i3:73-1341(+)